MGLIWLLIVVVLIMAVVALWKHLRSDKTRDDEAQTLVWKPGSKCNAVFLSGKFCLGNVAGIMLSRVILDGSHECGTYLCPGEHWGWRD
jgi:hypothetical protein